MDAPTAAGPARRYQGQNLGLHPHVAMIFGQEQIGDFVIATPLMRGLRERFPGVQMDYLGGEGTRQLEEASPLVDARYSLFGVERGINNLPVFLKERAVQAGPYDLVLNLDFDPVSAQAAALTGARFAVGPTRNSQGQTVLPPAEGIDRLWHDRWNRVDLLEHYPELRTQFIGEIFCRLARVDTDFARCEVPTEDPGGAIPDVLIATGGNRPAKLWPPEQWLALADWCRTRGVSAGLLGARPGGRKNYHTADTDDALIGLGIIDLRAPTLTLPQVAGALAHARAFIGIDAGLVHVAAAVHAPSIVIWGDGSARRIWAPPVPWVSVLEPSEPCSLCEENRFQNDACLLPVHQCMRSISPTRVIAELQRLLGG